MLTASLLASLLLASDLFSLALASKLSDVRQDAKGPRFSVTENSGVLPNKADVIGTGPERAFKFKRDKSKARRRHVPTYGGGGGGTGSRRQSTAVGLVVPACSCSTKSDDELKLDDIRHMSDELCSDEKNKVDVAQDVKGNRHGQASNMVWAWVRALCFSTHTRVVHLRHVIYITRCRQQG